MIGTCLSGVTILIDQTAMQLTENRAEEKNLFLSDIFAAVNYKEKESQEYQMDKHKEAETFPDSKLDTDWQDDGNIVVQTTDYRQDTLNTPAKFQQMSDWCLGRIDIARQCLKHTSSDPSSVNSAGYHDGPKASDKYKTKIDKMLRMNAIEPVQSVWTSQVLLGLKIGWIPTIFHWLLESEHCNHQGCVPDLTSGQLSGLLKRSAHTLDPWH